MDAIIGNRRAQDWIIVPILNAYRHSIEFANR
jgi:hypothetical protein